MGKIQKITSWFRDFASPSALWARPTYSQFGEDIVIREFFRKQAEGIYVDVGAYHPISYSNTYLLYRKGWRGITIEPNPERNRLFSLFRPRDTHLNVAISDREEVAELTLDHTFSSLIASDVGAGRSGQPLNRIKVHCYSLATLLASHLPDGGKIDLLTIDCEGHDLKVLQSNDWRRFCPKMILVEGDPGNCSDFDEFLCEQGYQFHLQLGMTRFYLRSKN